MSQKIHFKVKLFFSLFLFSLLSNLQAQSQKLIDSLERMDQSILDDSVKYIIEEELSWQKRNLAPVESLNHGKRAYEISHRMGDSKKMATALNRMANYYIAEGQYDSARLTLTDALRIESEIKNDYGMARAYGQLANNYLAQFYYDSAIRYAKKAIHHFRQLEDQQRLPSAYVRLGSIYRQANFLDSSIYVLHKALTVQEKSSRPIDKAQTLATMGNLYSDIHIIDSSLFYHKKAIALYKTTENKFELSSALSNLGTVYMKLRQDNMAKVNFQESIQLRKSNGWSNSINWNNLGILYQRENKPSEAELYFQKAIDVNPLNNITKAESFNNLGQLYLNLDRYNESFNSLKNSLSILSSEQPSILKLNIYEGLIRAGIQLKKSDEVSAYQWEYEQLRDDVETTIRATFLQRLLIGEQQKQLAIMMKNQELQTAEFGKRKAERLTFIFLVSLILLVGFILFDRQRRALRSRNKELFSQELENNIKDQDINMLSAMINGREIERKRIAQDLHDRLGSILTMVKMHFGNVQKNLDSVKREIDSEYEKTTQLIEDACQEVRQISHDLSSSIVHRFGLIHALNKLKETVEATGQLQVELQFFQMENEHLSEDLSLNLYRIIQEIVSNTVKHSEATILTLQLIRSVDEITMMAEDNGVGFDSKSENFKHGLGLYNMSSRTEKLGGAIHIDSKIGFGTTVTIDIPLKVH